MYIINNPEIEKSVTKLYRLINMTHIMAGDNLCKFILNIKNKEKIEGGFKIHF